MSRTSVGCLTLGQLKSSSSNYVLGKQLLELRKRRGFSQRKLAKLAGVDYTYISKIENGNLRFTPSKAVISRIKRSLNEERQEEAKPYLPQSIPFIFMGMW